MVRTDVKTTDTTLADIVRRIVGVADPDKVILFGGRARGEAAEGSDYDILVVADSDEPQYARTGPLYIAMKGIPTPVDVVWWTAAEIEQWREARSFFVTRAIREGEVVYERAA